MPDGRKTLCDKCGRVKPDCIWVQRADSGNQYVLCWHCRENWRAVGVTLRNVDPDFPLVKVADEQAAVLVKRG